MEYLNKKIGNYLTTRFIGEGGMASVYEGVHEKLGTKVALKILNPMLSGNAQIRQRFENEARFMASLSHPNIIKVLDFYELPDMLAIVMELLEGEDLSDWIEKKGNLKKEEAISLFLQILDAFGFAHEKGIVHRDIKPSNIFIEKGGGVKVLDFGIAKIFGTANDMTSTGTQIGTPAYMSPEQVKGDKTIDHRSDIYSLGVTLFFVLNGKPPYDNTTESNFDIFTKVVTQPLPELTQYPEVNAIIKKAVAKDRNMRFQGISEFVTALKATTLVQKDADKTILEVPNNKQKPTIQDADKTILGMPTQKDDSKTVLITPDRTEIISKPTQKNTNEYTTAEKAKSNKKPIYIVATLAVIAVLVWLGITLVNKTPTDPTADLIEYTKQWNMNLFNKDAKSVAELYTDLVYVYGDTVSKFESVSRKEKFFAKYTDYTQSIAGDIVIKKETDTSYTAEFTKNTLFGGKKQTVQGLLTFVYQNQKWLINKETDDVTEKYIAKKKEEKRKECEESIVFKIFESSDDFYGDVSFQWISYDSIENEYAVELSNYTQVYDGEDNGQIRYRSSRMYYGDNLYFNMNEKRLYYIKELTEEGERRPSEFDEKLLIELEKCQN